jgi:divalent metal cation (Fe/Co/Zn/Cd) transporter
MSRRLDPAPLSRGKRAARAGILTNALLAAFKLVAGVAGNSYALIADAIESSADVVSSTIVRGGLQVAGREPDDQYPFG